MRLSQKRKICHSLCHREVASAPILYLAYASTLKSAILDDTSLYGYADDHALQNSFNPNKTNEEKNALSTLENTAVSVKHWMDTNRLRMNDSKTEFIQFGSRQNLQKCETKNINVNGTSIERVPCITYLGTHLDQILSFKDHVKYKCRVAMGNIFKIKSIRNMLCEQSCASLILGLVISHLDYANALYIETPDVIMNQLQRVQNIAAKVVLNKKHRDSATMCLKKLHWLPIRFRVKFKILCLVYKCLHGNAPEYLKDLLILRGESRGHYGLRSRTDNMLLIPRVTRKTFANRSFSVQGPKLWNGTPDYIKEAETIETFKKLLKTYLFSQAFA